MKWESSATSTRSLLISYTFTSLIRGGQAESYIPYLCYARGAHRVHELHRCQPHNILVACIHFILGASCHLPCRRWQSVVLGLHSHSFQVVPEEEEMVQGKRSSMGMLHLALLEEAGGHQEGCNALGILYLPLSNHPCDAG